MFKSIKEFFKTRRIQHLEIKLAGAQASLDMENKVSEQTKLVYPVVLTSLKREIAEYEKELSFLKN